MFLVWLSSLTIIITLFGAIGFAGDLATTDLQCTMLTVVTPVRPASDAILTQQDMVHYMPTNISPTTNSQAVMSQIQTNVEQKVLDDFIKSKSFKQTAAGHTLNKVESFSQKTLGNDTNKVTFKFKPIERQLAMVYEGPIKSELTVDPNGFRWILSKAVGARTTLAITTSASMDMSTTSSILSLNHSF